MHGGLKSKANFYGINPFGGPDFLFLVFYLVAAGFYFSSLLPIRITQASKKKNNLISLLKWLVWLPRNFLPCFSISAQRNYIFQTINDSLNCDSFAATIIFNLMYPEQNQTQHTYMPNKTEVNTGYLNSEISTAVKKGESLPFYTQTTPRENKRILLYDQLKRRHLFPLVRDREIGILTKYQNVVIQSYNDDDKQTSSTQMRRGIVQTVEDLYDVLDELDNSQH